MRRNRKPPAANGRSASVRVAIYCRQSVASDLEYGSIEAQRDAVEALVASRKADGWEALPTRYDDGGFSGGTTDRPAFQRLLADVRAGRVDVVAVYKLDRASRSLADLAGFLALLDQHDVGFVASSQSIDTSGSTGRLLLHILGSVAQFEREAISERTRDKVLAARRRGHWTGGRPVLGYDAQDKQLVVNEEEAAAVNEAFALYLQTGSLQVTVAELERRGIRTKLWTSEKGRALGGRPFSKDALADLLHNVIYVGEMRCGDEVVEGRQDAIVDRATWDAVQQRLAENSRGDSGQRNRWDVLLRGIAVCSCGSPLAHATAKKRSRVYRYYHCSAGAACTAPRRTRVPAAELDAFVISKLRAIGEDPQVLEQAIAAARQESKMLRRPLQASLRRLEAQRRSLAEQREGLLLAAANAGADGQPALVRVAAIDRELETIDSRLAAARDEIARLDATVVDVDRLREQIAAFDLVFEQLTTAERARLIALLVQRVVVDADAAQIEVHFFGDDPGPRRQSA